MTIWGRSNRVSILKSPWSRTSTHVVFCNDSLANLIYHFISYDFYALSFPMFLISNHKTLKIPSWVPSSADAFLKYLIQSFYKYLTNYSSQDDSCAMMRWFLKLSSIILLDELGTTIKLFCRRTSRILCSALLVQQSWVKTTILTFAIQAH